MCQFRILPFTIISVIVFLNGCSASESFESLEKSLIEDVERSARAAVRVDAEQARAIIDVETSRANRFVDFALGTVGKAVRNKGDHGISLPDRKRQVSKKILGIRFRAFANFYNGTINGLQSVHRIGDALLIDGVDDGSLSLAFDVTLEDVEVKYGFKVTLMDVGPGGQVTGKLKSIKIHLKIKMGQDGGLSVDDFDVKDTGLFTVHTSGLGPLNFVFSGISVVIGNLSKRLLLESLESKLKNCMNEALEKMTTGPQKRGLKIMMKAMLLQRHEPPTTTPAPPPLHIHVQQPKAQESYEQLFSEESIQPSTEEWKEEDGFNNYN